MFYLKQQKNFVHKIKASLILYKRTCSAYICIYKMQFKIYSTNFYIKKIDTVKY